MAKCEGCGNLGYRIATRDEGLMAIERCDTCERFASDEDARNYVEFHRVLPNFQVEADAPCYITVSLNGWTYRLIDPRHCNGGTHHVR
jgi:hypothetical protein